MEKEKQLGFADIAVSTRKIKGQFFSQLNLIVNWGIIDKDWLLQ